MATDFNKPVVTDLATAVLPSIVTAIQDLARGLEPTLTGTSTNIPTGTIRWNASTNLWERFNGTTWAALATTYAISISGNAATATTAAACSGNSATATSATSATTCTGNAATATTATSATSATTATNLAGGGAGTVPYQSAIGTTVQLAAGTAGQVYSSNGAAAPSWIPQSSIAAGSATNATNLNGSGTITDTTTLNGFKIGYRDVPQLLQAPATAMALVDAGKHYMATAAGTWTIPNNATVAFPIGTALSFVNTTGTACSIAITATDTLTLAGVGTTGTRTLASNGIATALKITATSWIISGSGLT